MLCPEVINFEAPKTSLCIKKVLSSEFSPDKVNNFFCSHLVSVVVPDILNLPDDLIQSLTAESRYYEIKNLSLLSLIDQKFINRFVKKGYLTHCTCLAHGVDCVAETIRTQFSLVNDLIQTGKKVFSKASFMVQLFWDRMQGGSLPPEPVITIRGAWLDVTNYYADHFERKLYSSFLNQIPKRLKSVKRL